MRRCPSCNALLLENTTYCGNCGLKQELIDEKICIKCNNSIPVDSKFCPHCGTAATIKAESKENIHIDTTESIEPTTRQQVNSEKISTSNQTPIITYELDPYILSAIDNFKFSFTKKYAEFNGRASRGEYCRYILIETLIFVLMLAISLFISYISKKPEYVLWGVFLHSIVFFLPTLAISTRRAHDLNNPGWTSLILFIPYINILYTFYLLLKKGDIAPNNYGFPTSFEIITPKISEEKDIQLSPTSDSPIKFILTIVVLIGIIIAAFVSIDSNNSHTNASKNKVTPTTSTSTQNPKGNVTQVPQATQTSVTTEKDYIEQSTKALKSYYDKLNQKNFSGAYALLSEQHRANVGYYDKWKNGYNTTLNIKLASIKVLSSNPNQVIYEYQLHARDLINGKIKNQIFTGNVTMTKENATWVIRDQDGKLISSYFE